MSLKLLIISHACSLPQNQKLFALAAASRKWQVTMVIPDPWKNEYGSFMRASLCEGFDATLVTAPVIKNGSVPLHAYRMRAARFLKSLKPDIVYSHNEPYALSTIQWCQANTSAGNKPFGFFSCQNLVKRYPIPFRQAEAWVYRKSSFAFPITESVDKVHRQKGFKHHSTIMPLGFDPQQYAAIKEVRQRHRSSQETFTFTFVGRVVEEKGLITLAKALGKIRDLQWKLIMIGSGPYEPEVRKAITDSGVEDRIEWRGFIPHAEVARFYETVDCLLLPSESRPNWKEQFGRVLVESMACGTPVIGSDSGEIPIIIKQTGGGITFKETDADSCAIALRQMITDREGRATMAVSGHEYVHQHYALPKLAERFADAIESAAMIR